MDLKNKATQTPFALRKTNGKGVLAMEKNLGQ